MNIAVIQFPGSNCDQDCIRLCRDGAGFNASLVWHASEGLEGFDAIIVPGGFSYGDYLRCGAIARFSPIMRSVARCAEEGLPILGICNGFQVLCEAGLLPGALIRNRGLRFVCAPQFLRVESSATPFTYQIAPGTRLQLPVAHGEGCYMASPETLQELKDHDQIVVRYCDAEGRITPESNPNGSIENIAGVCNRARNVFGLMPHPDRAFDAALGSIDGLGFTASLTAWLARQAAA